MRKTAPGLAVALVLAVLAFTCIAVHHFDGTLRSARLLVARAGSLDFTLEAIVPASGPVFEPVVPANTITTAASFEGGLYVAGPSGLAIYESANASPRRLRTGIELPPAPIVALCVAHLRGQPGPQLLGITHGAGLLVLDANGPPRQLLPSSRDARDLTAVLPFSSGDLLLGTRRAGVLLFDGSRLRPLSPLLAGVDVTALAGSEDDFWIGTRNRGLAHWHSGQLDFLGVEAGLPDETILSLADSPRGLFAGTPLGVAQIVDGHVSRRPGRGLFAQSIAVQGDSLLVATVDQGLETIALKARAEPVAFQPPPVDENSAKLIVSGGEVFALRQGALMRRTQGGAWQTVLAAPVQTAADSDVAALSFSPDGRLWIGYFNHGLDVFDPATDRAQHLEDDHLFCINRIVADPTRRTMDVGTANGLVLLDGSAAAPVERQVLTRRDGLAADQVTDIAFTENGTMLATPAGVTVLTRSGAESIGSFQGLANNHVYALAGEPGSSVALAGTLAGVSVMDGLSVTSTVSLRNSSLPRNWITAVARMGAPGAQPLWFVGTYGGSVVQLDGAGRITRLDTPTPNAVINFNALLVTPQHVFAGTLENGLLVYDRGRRRWTQIVSGLPSLNVTAFAARGGEIYVGTTNGIVRVPEQALP
jgi:ligand-binding sensor domain-containing protein